MKMTITIEILVLQEDEGASPKEEDEGISFKASVKEENPEPTKQFSWKSSI